MEYRRRCNVCGKIYCYSDEDLSNNTSNSAIAALSALGGIASIFGGTRLDTYVLNNQTDRYNSKVVDYNKCPSCNSSNTSFLTDAEWNEIQQKETSYVQAGYSNKKIDINSNATSESLLKRTKMLLEDEDWDSASAYCEQILDIDPECAMAYVYKLMIKLQVSEQDKLAFLSKTFTEEKLYQKAIKFADDSLKDILEGYNNAINERNIESAYLSAVSAFNTAKTEQDYKALIPEFKALANYKNSVQMIKECEDKAVLCKYNHAVQLKQRAKTEKEFLEAKDEFDTISTYSDARTLSTACGDKAEEARKNVIYDEAVSSASSFTVMTVEKAVKEFEKIPGWRDADQKKSEALNRIIQLKEAEKKAANKKKTIILLSSLAVIICAAVIIFLNNQHKAELYQNAYSYYQNGDYAMAESIFVDIKGYSNSNALADECRQYINYETGINLFAKGEYADAKTYLQSAKGADLDSYIAYCDVAISVEEIDYGTNLTTIYREILDLNNFNNANQLIDENRYLKQVKEIEGVWVAESGLFSGTIEINNGVFSKDHDIYQDLYAWSGNLYTFLQSEKFIYNKYSEIIVNGSTLEWNLTTYKK